MIRHCVFIRYSASVAAEEKAAILAGIEGLKAHVDGMLTVQSGPNVSPETGMDKGYSEGFIIDFADAAARDRYLVHPLHQALGARIVAAATGGVEGVFVYDLEIAG
ncbi:stress responsive protein [Rhizobium rhizosphaerae]|uniref:Stress responsive protein n=1 Tax=Xaviernesmea rhizosphaerae TaxID=1672749 RepID=A0A1Q9ADV2_9HYPH|nr:Dabb family protein [Xaviernesmea rhizosphaerae]OLP53113.1 stress responsive protein [Xaviernesmea rhizosphaerae]OQP87324.1 stress responsive protein [Xaviernesmea rhizosphaerae]